MTLATKPQWVRFTFYYGTLTGWRLVRDGVTYEVIPTNGRPNSFDVTEDYRFTGETFATVDEAKAWVQP